LPPDLDALDEPGLDNARAEREMEEKGHADPIEEVAGVAGGRAAEKEVK
jgi:hypothetical protein